MILILEDDPQRQCMFSRAMIDQSMMITNDAMIAFEAMTKIRFDEIWLDNDLGSSKEHDGRWLAKRFHETNNKDAKIIIHSMNPVASEDIARILVAQGCSAVVRRPYSMLRFG